MMSHRGRRHRNQQRNPPRDYFDGLDFRPSHQSGMFGHNFDFGGFIALVKNVHMQMMLEDYRMERWLPFCVFQHAMTEILTARMLALTERRFDAKHFYEGYFIPLPIYLYIEGIGTSKGKCGTQIDWNLPKAAVPQKRIEGEKPCRSGTFGIPTAANHNAYECYISPYITSEYIKRQAMVTEETTNLNWDPFPNGWLPDECEVNENLLGYHPLEKLHIEALSKCSGCTFDDDDGITGILCHSRHAMMMVSHAANWYRRFKWVKAQFEHTESLAAFVFKEYQMMENLKAVLWQNSSAMHSPYEVTANVVCKSSVFGYKRKRNAAAPGVFALCNGKVIDGWLETINDNFQCTGLFGIRFCETKESLTHGDHSCRDSSAYGFHLWLDQLMTRNYK